MSSITNFFKNPYVQANLLLAATQCIESIPNAKLPPAFNSFVKFLGFATGVRALYQNAQIAMPTLKQSFNRIFYPENRRLRARRVGGKVQFYTSSPKLIERIRGACGIALGAALINDPNALTHFGLYLSGLASKGLDYLLD